MTKIQAQKMMTADLPTLLVDSKGRCQGTTETFLEQFGYLAIPATVEFAADLASISLTLRLLTANYSPPANASPAGLETVNRVNAALAERLTGR